MEEKDASIELLRKTVKELLSFVEEADKMPKESFQMQKFFIDNRNRISELGRIVVTMAGMPADSLEALKFGRLFVSNYICSNIVSTQFLTRVLTDEVAKEVLKEEIISFVKSLTVYLEKDKENLLMTIQKEKDLLQKLKDSEKAAKSDPEWTKEIEILEKRIKNISILVLDKKATESSRKRIERIKEQNNPDFIELMESLSRLKCFCSFRKNKKPSKYALLRETTLHILETEQICYISVMPFLCQENKKFNIEMCSPTGQDVEFIPTAKKYIEYIFTELMKASPENSSNTIEMCLKEYRETGTYKREHIQDVLLEHSPPRAASIQKAMESLTNTIFYINIVRCIYLVIHDFAYHSMLKYKKTEKIDLSLIFLRENKKYHNKLIRQYVSKMEKSENISEEPKEKNKKHLQNYSFLVDRDAISSKFHLVRAISHGIFTEENILSEYFKEYHTLRRSVLNTLLDILSRKISSQVYEEMLEKKGKHKNVNQMKKESRETPKELSALVRRRILSTLQSVATRFMKTKSIKPRAFLYSIHSNEFEKRGLPRYHKEMYMFLMLALPLFAFSSSILGKTLQ
ncbi:hypothetical protein NEMIN01_1908 [Nematocida minor]|uniref:uncharacterized protein n=1 Tax=Nematocida minor TaxID=1912983 RepID=UPI00221E57CF|nr:uncharacterized protein NEMIN01_1908 [Nematocida minor]KAI5192256.1 hypothetical protein NEMIN01_1908 [Nematocida minor]